MAKKKKNSAYRTTGPEAFIKEQFAQALSIIHKTESTDYINNTDMDAVRMKRRQKAACSYIEKLQELVTEQLPWMDKDHMIREWGFLNSLPVETYDSQEFNLNLITAAAIWMLDHIKQGGHIHLAKSLLPPDDGQMDDVNMPTLYDPVHDDSVIRSMVYAISERNRDCTFSGQKARKQAEEDNHVLADIFTANRLHHQDVPSRARFEALLELIPKADIDQAVSRFEEKLKEAILRYYRFRAVYLKKERELDEKRDRLDDRFEAQIGSFAGRERIPKSIAEVSDFMKRPTSAFGNAVLSNPKDALEYLFYEMDTLDRESEKLLRKVTSAATISSKIADCPYALLEHQYGPEGATILYEFSVDDPYEMCFALLYLFDTDSELPWLYYPGTVVSGYAGRMLPWAEEDYDELEDSHWAEYYGPDYQRPPSAENGLELPDLYRMDYHYRSSDATLQWKYNLAQLLYQQTGGIMPRNMHRYDDTTRVLKRHGVTGKKLQTQMLLCMSLLGEGFTQTAGEGLGIDWDWDDEPSTQNDGLEADDAAASAEADSRIAELQAEIKRMKTLAANAEQDLRNQRKEYDALLRRFQSDHRELAELREILFSQENETEAKLEPEAEEIELPYTLVHSTVIFGGHDTWAKAIRPKLQGSVRFVDRNNMKPDADLIRHADMVWIQPNCISHAVYYKIISVARTYNKPFHYFKFASAEKCARQLAAEDQRLGAD